MVALSKFRLFWDIYRIKVTICDALANLMTKYAKRKYQLKELEQLKNFHQVQKAALLINLASPRHKKWCQIMRSPRQNKRN